MFTKKKGDYTPTTKYDYNEQYFGVARTWWIYFDSISCHLNLVVEKMIKHGLEEKSILKTFPKDVQMLPPFNYV